MRKIILASASPRRKELMEQINFSIEVIPSRVEEIITETDPAKIVEELSLQKAWDVYKSCEDKDALVVGADTVVALQGKILGKPKDKEDAFRMLRSLSGNVHEVFTGVTMVWTEEETKTFTFHECTKVSFYEISETEMEVYINTNRSAGDSKCPVTEWEDKAGAYGIQGLAAKFVKKIEGDYNNVVGLPVARLYHEIASRNIL